MIKKEKEEFDERQVQIRKKYIQTRLLYNNMRPSTKRLSKQYGHYVGKSISPEHPNTHTNYNNRLHRISYT